MKSFFKHKKIFSRVLIIALIISLSFSGLAASKVYAIFPVNVVNTPLKPVQVGNTLDPNPLKVSDGALANKYVGVTVLGHTVPGFSWNAVYILVMKTLLAQITDSIVTWINSGFPDDGPSFVTDPEEFLLGVGDEVVGEFINEMTTFGWLCDPYRLNIRIALSLGVGSFKRQRKCTLTAIIKNFDNFVNGTFKEGGWKGWFYLTTNPNATPGSAFLSVQAELQKRMQQNKDMEIDKLNWGRGFMSWKTCEAYATTDSSEGSESSKDGRGTTFGSPEIVNDSSGNSRKCVKWSGIKTPGSVIQDQLSFTLGTSLRQMELADDIDKIVGALVTQLVKTVLQKGLSSMNSNDGWSGTSGDLEQRSDSTKMTGACSADTGSALTGDTVEWTVYVSGGSSKKVPVYKWNGTEIASNTITEDNSLKIEYGAPGTKRANVKVTKGNQTIKIKCGGTVKVATGDDSEVSSSGNEGYCSASKSAIKVGNSVKWTWTPYEANSSYNRAVYEWKDENGNAIEGAGNSKSFTIYYNDAGEKSASVIVTKDGASSDYDCGAVDVSDGSVSSNSSSESITADSCSVDKTTALVNQTVRWSASLADNSASATYKWLFDGEDNLSGDTKSIEVSYPSVGTASTSVEITKGETTTWASCPKVEITNTKLSASCSVDPIAGAVDTGQGDGTEFTWTAKASGGVGGYGYSWSGTDGLIGSGETTAATYTTAGDKTAQVTITSGDESATVKCDGAARVFSQ